jgi:hypothetical protein
MDEVRIWNVVRTQEQIQDHMHCELAGNESGLIGYWKFNEASGSIAYDSSPYGNHAYLYGGATLVPSSAPSGGPIVQITGMSQRSFPSKLLDVRFVFRTAPVPTHPPAYHLSHHRTVDALGMYR